jgi:hypothetical protein
MGLFSPYMDVARHHVLIGFSIIPGQIVIILFNSLLNIIAVTAKMILDARNSLTVKISLLPPLDRVVR